MTVPAITDPPNYGSFPYDEEWSATATILSDDAVDGILYDSNNPNGVYPGTGNLVNGPDGNGLYTWNVSFIPDQNIQLGDPLVIYCYDAEIDSDASSVEVTASLVGTRHLKERRPRMPHADAPSLTITAAKLSPSSVPVTVKLTPQTKGGVLLLCANVADSDIRKHTRWIQMCCLPPSDDDTRNHTFKDINTDHWDHIYAIGVTYRHKAPPQIVKVK